MHPSKTILALILMLPVVSTLGEKSHGASDRKEIGTLVIGTVFPHSGPQAPYGEEAFAGVEIALESLVKSDPDLAAHINLLKGDDQSTPQGARSAAQELIAKRASILIGSVTNPSSKTLAEISHEFKKPLIIPASSSLSIGPMSPYVFRSCAIDRWQGKLLGEFAIKELKMKKAAILLDPKVNYSHDIVENFKRTFNSLGGGIVHKELYLSAKPQFRRHITNIAKTNADFILFPSESAKEVAEVMLVLKKVGLHIPLLGGDRWGSPSLKKQAKGALAGHYYAVPFTAEDPNPRTQAFVDSFKKKMRRYPSALAAMTYDAFLLAANSFKRARTNRATELVRSIKRTKDLPALLGPLSINAQGFAEKSALIMVTTKKGPVVKSTVHPSRVKM
ncbi:MAG: ABC transporter substrate-binding protein [Oligoflexales bacterium]